MKRQSGKLSGWMYVGLFFVAAALVYGLVIEPMTQSGNKTADVILQQTATDAPIDAPTAVPTDTPTDTPAPATKAPTATPAPTDAPTPVPTATEAPTLRQGDKGQAVRQLQTELIRLGYLSGNADGDFGKKTAQAVKDFQVCNGLKEDGIFGAQCWDKMFGWVSAIPQKTVYVSKNNIYHTDEHCSGMKSSTKMKLSDAIRKGIKGHNCH